MTDETSTTPPQGSRAGGNREPGGFRIRLSDNEMRSARALQEALGLRSTVAVLGFCVRTLGQMLEEGKLDDVVAQQRSQAGKRKGGRPRRPAGEGPGRPEKAARVDPFARPSRPAPAPAEAPDTAEAAVVITDAEDSAEDSAEGLTGDGAGDQAPEPTPEPAEDTTPVES
jgi:hypothetical protein